MLLVGTTLHELAYVIAAVVICLMASWAAFRSVRELPVAQSRAARLQGHAVIVVASGLGVWATHFIAMLGIQPLFVIGYSAPETLGSIGVAMLLIGGALSFAASARSNAAALVAAGGAGVGVAAMHHVGMRGLSGCVVDFDPFGVFLSTSTAIVMSGLAMALVRRRVRFAAAKAALTFSLGVAALHFGSIYASTFRVGPDALYVISTDSLWALQVMALLVILIPISIIAQKSIERLREASLSAEVALATGEGVVTMDPNGRILWANEAFRAMSSSTLAELEGLCSVEAVETAASPQDAARFRHAIETETSVKIETRLSRGGDAARWVEIRLIPRHRDDGVLIGFVAAHRDVTSEKKAVERLKISEAKASRLAIVAEHATDAILISDADGRTIWVNPSFEKVTGYRLEEVTGRKPGATLQGPDTDSETVDRIRSALADIRPIRTEILNYTKDGASYWIELEITPVREAGAPLRFVAVSRDVTERVEREARLREARRRAEAADRMKTAFLARMSHEIRTPMNGVTGMVELLGTTTLDEPQRLFVDQIKLSSERLLRVVNDILDASAFEEGRIPLSLAPFDIRALAEEAIAVVAPAAQEKGLSLTVSVADDLPDQVVGDDGRIRQVLLNLLSNGVKFTPEGSVTLTIDGEPPDDARDEDVWLIRFSVRDTGVGIAESARKRVFEPFRQIDESARRRHEGTGLGLSIARDIVKAMDGDLRLVSAEGSGSEFSFELPLSRHAAADASLGKTAA